MELARYSTKLVGKSLFQSRVIVDHLHFSSPWDTKITPEISNLALSCLHVFIQQFQTSEMHLVIAIKNHQATEVFEVFNFSSKNLGSNLYKTHPNNKNDINKSEKQTKNTKIKSIY